MPVRSQDKVIDRRMAVYRVWGIGKSVLIRSHIIAGNIRGYAVLAVSELAQLLLRPSQSALVFLGQKRL